MFSLLSKSKYIENIVTFLSYSLLNFCRSLHLIVSQFMASCWNGIFFLFIFRHIWRRQCQCPPFPIHVNWAITSSIVWLSIGCGWNHEEEEVGLRSEWTLLIPRRCAGEFWWGCGSLISWNIDVSVLRPPMNVLFHLTPECCPEFPLFDQYYSSC